MHTRLYTSLVSCHFTPGWTGCSCCWRRARGSRLAVLLPGSWARCSGPTQRSCTDYSGDLWRIYGRPPGRPGWLLRRYGHPSRLLGKVYTLKQNTANLSNLKYQNWSLIGLKAPVVEISKNSCRFNLVAGNSYLRKKTYGHRLKRQTLLWDFSFCKFVNSIFLLIE